MRRVLLLLVLAAIAWGTSARACTTFCMTDDGPIVYGKNYDWEVEEGMLFVNKRGVEKTASTRINPAHWRSRLGSVTFNQYGREYPCGGMNEAGLVIEVMWLDETSYPQRDQRASVGLLQWVQYQLDNAATVDAVLASDADIRIEDDGLAAVHYLVADRTGQVAAIEFLDGKMVAHTGAQLDASVLTNDTYQRSSGFLTEHAGFGGKREPGASGGSLDRFVRAADQIRESSASAGDSRTREQLAFDILSDVKQGVYTKWSIVYNLTEGTIHYRTFSNKDVRGLRLADFDFDCASPVQCLHVNDPSMQFQDYTRQANYDSISKAISQTSFLRDIPGAAVSRLASYPETCACTVDDARAH